MLSYTLTANQVKKAGVEVTPGVQYFLQMPPIPDGKITPCIYHKWNGKIFIDKKLTVAEAWSL